MIVFPRLHIPNTFHIKLRHPTFTCRQMDQPFSLQDRVEINFSSLESSKFSTENFCSKFRTRETRDAGVDLENLAIVGEQVRFLGNTRNSFLFRRTGWCAIPASPTSVSPRGPPVPLYPGQRLSASPALRLPCKRSTTIFLFLHSCQNRWKSAGAWRAARSSSMSLSSLSWQKTLCRQRWKTSRPVLSMWHWAAL